jgi:deoxyribonuclease V
VALAYPELALVDENVATQTVTFPYIPGLLSFREAPVCLAAVEGLETKPDLVLVDGQGRAHPRRFGIACHVGYELGIPTIGVAKSILVGRHGELGEERGSTAPLIDRNEVIGMAVRTKPGTKPVYVSVGNLITLEEAVDWVLRTTGRYRLPEPSRLAHKLAQTRATELRSGEGKA